MEVTRISGRAVAKVVLIAILVVMGVGYAAEVLSRIGQVVGWVLVAAFLAVALGPPVEFLVRRGLKRWLAIIAVYFGITAAIFGVGLLIVPPIAGGVNQLAENLPGYIDDLSERSSQFREYDERYHISDKLEAQASELPSRLGSAAGTLADVTVGVFQRILAAVTILVLTFFLLLDGRKWGEGLLGLMPAERAARVRAVSAQIYQAVAGYVTGNLAISVIAGIVAYVTLSLLGVPFAVTLAVLMAFLDLIPLVGATLGGVTIGIVTLFVDFPRALIVWAIVFVVYQQIENHLVQPVIYRRAVALHPFVVIVAILVGGTLLGVLGALVAIPAAAAAQIVVKDWWAHRGAPAPGAEPAR